MTVCFDSNILIYAFTLGEARQPAAMRIVMQLSDRGGPLPDQVLREFLAVAHRKGFAPLETVREVAATFQRRFKMCSSNATDLINASEFVQRHRFQFYDALLCMTAAGAGATHLISEDMQDGFVVDRMRIIDPFHPANREALQGIGLA